MSQLNQQERNWQGYDQNLVFVTGKICTTMRNTRVTVYLVFGRVVPVWRHIDSCVHPLRTWCGGYKTTDRVLDEHPLRVWRVSDRRLWNTYSMPSKIRWIRSFRLSFDCQGSTEPKSWARFWHVPLPFDTCMPVRWCIFNNSTELLAKGGFALRTGVVCHSSMRRHRSQVPGYHSSIANRNNQQIEKW